MKTVTAVESFTGYPGGARAHFSAGEDYELTDKTATAWAAQGLVRIKPANRKPSKNTDADSE